jgi:hypothetical protein
MCLLRAASRSRRQRAADMTACSAACGAGWIDATKRLKKLERRVGGGGRNIGLGAPVVRLH